MKVIKSLLMATVALAITVLVAGQAGFLSGTPPTDLGVRDGRFKAPSSTANSVSSQTALWPGHPQAAYAAIDPLPLRADGAASLQKLQELIKATPGGKVAEARSDYVRAEFSTRWLGFVDDAEFWLDPAAGVIQVRSSSRLGREDFGVNRQRIESLRSRLAAS